VRLWIWIAVASLFLCGRSPVSAHPLRRYLGLERINARLCGRVLDFTHNHGADRRFWSEALCKKRDMYVYVPPGFEPSKQYPLLIWLHGHAEDEFVFLHDVIGPLDQAIACGKLPPTIIAAPDGSIRGKDCLIAATSSFLNSEAGRYEDYLMVDVWNFLTSHFPIRPERDAHAIVGVSMGGGAAYNKTIKYPKVFRHVIGIFPALNLRWQDCQGHYRANFDPECWGWRTDYVHRRTILARYYGIPVRLRSLINPIFSRRSPEALPSIIRNNPVEMLDLYEVPPGLLDMYVCYGGKDEFNIDAQVESFLFVARRRGLKVDVDYDPKGHHNRKTAISFLPGIIAWLGPRLAPYAP
jgi:pimeloyl-ACP methyl ester carboxylesterase